MGSLQMQRADVLSFSRHAKERASITDTSLKASSGEIFSSLSKDTFFLERLKMKGFSIDSN